MAKDSTATSPMGVAIMRVVDHNQGWKSLRTYVGRNPSADCEDLEEDDFIVGRRVFDDGIFVSSYLLPPSEISLIVPYLPARTPEPLCNRSLLLHHGLNHLRWMRSIVIHLQCNPRVRESNYDGIPFMILSLYSKQ